MRGDLGNWLIEKANAAKRVISPSKSNGSPSKSSGSGEPSQSNKRSRQLDFNDVTEDGLQQIDLTESPPEDLIKLVEEAIVFWRADGEYKMIDINSDAIWYPEPM